MSASAAVSERDHVFQDGTGTWGFWDETEAYFYGPYDTEDEARAALADYVVRLAGYVARHG